MFVFICSKEPAAEESFECRYVLGNVKKEKKVIVSLVQRVF